MEYRFFEEGTIPEWTTPEWYEGRDRAPHLEESPHVWRLKKTAEFVLAMMYVHNDPQVPLSVVDLGAGDGGLLSLVKYHYPNVWGYDLQPTNIDGAKERGVDVRLANVITDPIEWGDIAVATEMLEHLVDPHAFVKEIAKRSVWLVCSSPNGETPESHYGFHTWGWDMDGYRALVEQGGYEVLDHQTDGMFQVILARLSA
jgi:hypothetical protein